MALPYQIIPPTLHSGDHFTYETLADAGGGTGISTLGCALSADALVALLGHGEEWRTEYYMEDVTTPIYSGHASVSEQWKNCNADRIGGSSVRPPGHVDSTVSSMSTTPLLGNPT